MFNSASFPIGVVPSKIIPKQTATTAGVFNTSEEVLIADCKCPEFGSRWIPDITAGVFHVRCWYDMIIRRGLLIPMGIIINFNNYTIQWIKHYIPMKESYQIHNQEGLPGEISMEYEDSELFTDEIIDRKYQLVTPKQVIDEQHHLNQDQKQLLYHVLSKYRYVFDRKLVHNPTARIHLHLKPGSSPSWKKHYPVPFHRKEIFKSELASLIADVVLIPMRNELSP